MSYVVLARKYRPEVFSDIIGQEHVSTTLLNAMHSEHVAHAYLFSGPRGVGKTTAARILARSLNCTNEDINKKPCAECDACKEIKKASSMDIIEIDGASNRGIDEIRDLRQNVKFAPVSLKYKIYIIDEVHMLTEQAFNALLKTLEEPPSHVMFLFATTEIHKVPDTILSRCQKFNFKLISVANIAARLKDILGKENIEYDTDALNIVAKASGGSMRDALSMLDQIVAYSPKKVGRKDAEFILGVLNDETLFKIVNLILCGNTKELILILDEILNEGHDLHQVIKELREYYRVLMLLKIDESLGEFLELVPEKVTILRGQVEGMTLGKITRDIKILSSSIDEMKWSDYPRVILELCLVKLSKPYIAPSELLDRLENMDNLDTKLVNLFPKIDGQDDKEIETKAEPQALPKEAEVQSESEPKPESEPEPEPIPEQEPKLEQEPKPEQEVKLEPDLKPEPETEPKTELKTDSVEPVPENSKEESVSPAAGLKSEPDSDNLEAKIRANWPRILEDIKTKKMYLGTYLKDNQPMNIAGQKVTLFLASKFYCDGILKNKDVVEAAFKNVAGKDIRIFCDVSSPHQEVSQDSDEISDFNEKVSGQPQEDIPIPSDEDKQRGEQVSENSLRYTPDEVIESEPIVQKFLDIFDGEIKPPN